MYLISAAAKVGCGQHGSILLYCPLMKMAASAVDICASSSLNKS